MAVNHYVIKKSCSEMFSQKALFTMGFNKKMIEAMLPEPVFRPNPHVKGGALMKLYPAEAVYPAIETEDFAAYRTKQKKQGGTHRNAAKEREQQLVEQAKRITVDLKIPVVDKEELLAAALECQADHYEQKFCKGSSGNDGNCWWRDDDDLAGYIEATATSSENDEWMLDYLLRVYTDFPRVEEFFRKERCGKRAACIVKHLYYTAAAKSNPYLTEACELRLQYLTLEAEYHPEDFIERG